MSTSIDPSVGTPTAEQTATYATRAKATIDKQKSILFRIKLQDAAGKHVPVYEVANKTIGFFCKCHPDFVLIYVSLDTTEAAFNKTLEAHPRWLAIPFNDPIKIDILNEWQTKGVPCLHIYDPLAHEILTSWGGSCLRFNFDHCFEEWRQGGHGISYWQIIKGWWYYNAPVGIFKDMTDQELTAYGFPILQDNKSSSSGSGSGIGGSSNEQERLESKKDK
ncbi:hypothetical protein BGZ54_008651 [Gamsiella multidivaricata]|nr:hypothetical protein BGZ54_008651 [Gamsiella multidivaricata]